MHNSIGLSALIDFQIAIKSTKVQLEGHNDNYEKKIDQKRKEFAQLEQSCR